MKRALKNKELKNVVTIMSDDPPDTKIAILSVSIVEKGPLCSRLSIQEENSLRKHRGIHKPRR